MNQPIEQIDIRKGDQLVFEWDEPAPENGFTSVTLIAQRDGQWPLGAVRAELLDRPKPTVTAPSVNALGFAEFKHGDTYTGVWRLSSRPSLIEGAVLDPNLTSDCWSSEKLTAFTPAVAVPKAALDDLRAYLAGVLPIVEARAHRQIREFLTAVDEANGGEL